MLNVINTPKGIEFPIEKVKEEIYRSASKKKLPQ
jgi:hypothetical protein